MGWAFSLTLRQGRGVSGQLAAIASMTAGVLIADVLSPAKPREGISVDSTAVPLAWISKTHGILADGWGGLVSVLFSKGNPIGNGHF